MNSARVRGAIATLALLGLACAQPEPPEPAGARLSAESGPLRLLLDRLARLEGTPLGHAAARLAAQLPDCAAVEARAAQPDLPALLDDLHCAGPERAQSGDIEIVWPLGSGMPLRARVDLDADANARLELSLPTALAQGVAALALPGETPPGPGLLSAADTLLHARIRPLGGIDLARLVPDDGQAAQLFRLKSALFAGTVLDGTWETAIYLPRTGESLPPSALAIGFTARAAAVAGMEQFIAELRETWGIARTGFSVGAADGACLTELRILPEFAPCYVATDSALVLGWNPRSLARALDAAGPRLAAQGGLFVALGRFAEADARLAAGRSPARATRGAAAPPWRALRATGRSAADAVHVQLRLEAEPDA